MNGEEELLALLQSDPEQGLDRLSARYGGLIAAVVGRILPGRPQDAEECCADALVRIWRSAPQLQTRQDTLRGFVIWAARSAAIDRYRRLRRESALRCDCAEELLELLPDTRVTDADAEQALLLRSTRAAVEAMPPPDDEIFLRHYFLCESVPAIAARLGMNVKTVESRLVRGRKRLRTQLMREEVCAE